MSMPTSRVLLDQSPLGRAWAAWNRFWFAPISPVSLALFRILFGALMLLFVALLAPELLTWFGRGGPFTPHDASTFWGNVPDYSLLLWFPAPAAVFAFFAVFTLAACCLMIGLWTRLSALLVFLGLVSIGHRSPLILNGGDTAFRMMAFYLILAPCGAALSVDRLRALLRGTARVRPPLVPPWAQRLLQLQMCLVYAMTVLLKLQGHAWQDGTALYYTSRLEAFDRFPLPLVFHSLPLVNLLSYWTLAAEIGLAVLVWVPGLRRFVLLNGVLLHLGIEYSMNIPLFAFAMLAWYVTFVDVEGSWAWLQAHWPLRTFSRARLYLREQSPMVGLLPLLAATDILGRIDFVMLDRSARIPGLQGRPRQDLCLVTMDGRAYLGEAAFRWLSWRLPVLWPVALLLPVPGVAAAMRLLYRQTLQHQRAVALAHPVDAAFAQKQARS